MRIKKNTIIDSKKDFSIILKKGVFSPNLTTKLLLSEIKNYSVKKKIYFKHTLDLGCGCGVIGIVLNKLGVSKNVYLSDISKKAIINANHNLELNKVKGNLRVGKMFEPWKNYKFDLIINDISAISSKLARISPWFKKIPCSSGNDGTKLSVNFLKQVKKYSVKKTKIFFPILSLSNEKKIIKFAKKKFKNVQIINSVEWPLPKKMLYHKKKLEYLKKNKFINYKEISGNFICKTSICLISL
jgi:predicted RNA methylase